MSLNISCIASNMLARVRTLPRRLSQRCHRHLSERIRGDLQFDSLIILNIAASGTLDLITFLHFRIFAFNQFGNLIFLANNIIDYDEEMLGHILLSMIAFIVTCLVFALTGWIVGADRRGFILGLAIFQAALVFVTGGMYTAKPESMLREEFRCAVIALLSCVSGSQATFARSVSVPDEWSRFDPFMRLGSVKLQNGSMLKSAYAWLSFGLFAITGTMFYGYMSIPAALFGSGMLRLVVVVLVWCLKNPRSVVEMELRSIDGVELRSADVVIHP